MLQDDSRKEKDDDLINAVLLRPHAHTFISILIIFIKVSVHHLEKLEGVRR